ASTRWGERCRSSATRLPRTPGWPPPATPSSPRGATTPRLMPRTSGRPASANQPGGAASGPGTRILVADGAAEQGLARLRLGAEVLVRAGVGEDALAAALPDVDALIVRSRTQVSAAALKDAARLRVIARAGVGVDNIDVEAATRQGIVVLNAPE